MREARRGDGRDAGSPPVCAGAGEGPRRQQSADVGRICRTLLRSAWLALLAFVTLAFCACQPPPGTALSPEPISVGTVGPVEAGAVTPAEPDMLIPADDALAVASGSAGERCETVDTAGASGQSDGGNGAAAPAAASEPARTGPAGASDAATPSPPSVKPDAYPLQENPLSGCPICHVDIEDEFVGSLHFREKVGCITCHGPSQAHLADENNEVKPDEVFARRDVNGLCVRCHECTRPRPPKPELTKDGQRKVCTDCHGAHDVALAADAGATGSP